MIIRSHLSTFNLLEQIRDHLALLKKQKYPPDIFSYVSGATIPNELKNEALPDIKGAVQIEYDASAHSKRDHSKKKNDLESIYQTSLAIRKLSIIAGLLTHLEDDHFLTSNPNIKQDILRHLEKWTETIWSEVQKTNQTEEQKTHPAPIHIFVAELIQTLASLTERKKEELTYLTHRAERYFVTESTQEKTLINIINATKETSPINSSKIIQISMPLTTQFTESQKKDFYAIHSDAPPLWFKNLEPWEQEWLRNQIPKNRNEENACQTFETLLQPCTMHQIPGLKNGKVNYLYLITHDQEGNQKPVLLSVNVKRSTAVPYEMESSIHEEQTLKNMEQMIEALERHPAFNLDSENPEKIIFIHSLLSDTIGNSNDRYLVDIQKKAINALKKKYPRLTIIAGNDPVHAFRFLAATNSAKRWEHANFILEKAEEFSKVTEHFLVKAASEELKKLKSSFFMQPKRNKQAFKSAYMQILVEAMGGIVSVNCKSGKDRTGFIEIYKEAMLIYFNEYGKLPGYNDKGADRKNFIDIFSLLFHSMKTQEEASINTPGSFGLKDNATTRVICHDIAKTLGEHYKQSDQRARWNKPSLIIKLEKQRKGQNPFHSLMMKLRKWFFQPIAKKQTAKQEAIIRSLENQSLLYSSIPTPPPSPTPNTSTPKKVRTSSLSHSLSSQKKPSYSSLCFPISLLFRSNNRQKHNASKKASTTMTKTASFNQ